MNILFVDDDHEEFEIFCEALAEAFPFHINCTFAQDGQQALNTLTNLDELPDYIFLDVNMPIMNGVVFLRNLRADSNFKNIKVVMHTTFVNPTETSLYKALTAEYITKSGNFKQYVAALKSVIKNPN